MNDLTILEQHMQDSLTVVRERKYHVIKTQTDTCRKRDTIHQLEKKYGMVENEVGYESTIAYSNLYGFCENPNNNIIHGSGYEPHGLRLD
ncbi:putative transcription factor, K-box [Helianthus annuus]|nr:putative transcription factor, K-box [Helianthus annuus]KAJ0462491.1 putative transcription factor, K-box [Helianthus annuus]